MEPLREAVRAPSRAAEETAVYVYSRRLMSIAVKRTSRNNGDTRANSTSAWLRWLRTPPLMRRRPALSSLPGPVPDPSRNRRTLIRATSRLVGSCPNLALPHVKNLLKPVGFSWSSRAVAGFLGESHVALGRAYEL